mmetsp:Transcript_5438/g.20818  ORF Transcript_5438/g.20818 Transcript_5438/m.20818 type:complete len:82 (+) Transcript_5438:1182-1427(+)
MQHAVDPAQRRDRADTQLEHAALLLRQPRRGRAAFALQFGGLAGGGQFPRQGLQVGQAAHGSGHSSPRSAKDTTSQAPTMK